MKKKMLIFLGLVVLTGGVVVVSYSVANKRAEEKYMQYQSEEVRTALDKNTASMIADAASNIDMNIEVVDGYRQVTDDEFNLVWNLALPYTTNFTKDNIKFDITTNCYIITTDTEYLLVDLELNEVYYTKLR